MKNKWKENYDQMSNQIIKQSKNLNNILVLRWNNKFKMFVIRFCFEKVMFYHDKILAITSNF